MKNTFIALVLALAAILFSSCEMEGETVQAFTFSLQGTWITNNPDAIEYEPGKIVIDFTTITISGFGIKQGFPNAFRPFNNFAKTIPLRGFSENNALFINQMGTLQRIPYHLEDIVIGNPRILYLTFGEEKVILQKE